MQVDHLDGGKLFQHAAWRQSRRQRVQAPRQRDVQAIGQEGDEDVGLDARLALVKDRPALPAAETLAARGGQRGSRTPFIERGAAKMASSTMRTKSARSAPPRRQVRGWGAVGQHQMIAAYCRSEWAERGEI